MHSHSVKYKFGCNLDWKMHNTRAGIVDCKLQPYAKSMKQKLLITATGVETRQYSKSSSGVERLLTSLIRIPVLRAVE